MGYPSDPGNFLAHADATAAGVNARFAAIYAALVAGGLPAGVIEAAGWTPYTPTCATLTVGTGGTISGAYSKVGRTVNVRGAIVFGTGGSFSSGTAQISLPVESAAGSPQFGVCRAVLASSGFRLLGEASINPSSSVFVPHFPDASGAANQLVDVGPSLPFTWGLGAPITGANPDDTLRWQLAYESAS